ncbi:MAG: DUF3810 family protein, partial [Oscillospiraceae bacterium]|nr:DUF3810 family protein [Oscillospiraceae bacterium]
LGFAPEEDANLVAYLACMESDNAVFLYSGSLMAFTYCYNAVTDPRAKGIIWDRLAENSEETLGDFSGNSEAWSEYEGPLRKTAEAVNNAYLQSMGQPEGIRSYGRVVDMLIALYLADETRNGS